MSRVEFLAALLALALPSIAMATKPCPLPTQQMLRGAWIGSGDMGGYARLTISANGSGLLALEEALSERPVSLYRLDSLKISGYTFGLRSKAAGKSPPTRVTGEFLCRLKLFRQVLNRQQQLETYELEREEYVLPRIRAVRRAVGVTP